MGKLKNNLFINFSVYALSLNAVCAQMSEEVSGDRRKPGL